MSLPILSLTPLGLGLSWAIVTDLRWRRIPNAVSAFVLVGGLVLRGYHGGIVAALSGLAAALLILLVLYRPWQAGGIGGGDVKLASAVAAWVGLSQLIWFALASAVAGGIVAAAYYFKAPASTRADARANLTLAWVHGDVPPAAGSHRKGHVSLPYALAIATGAAVALIGV